jgi:hypothetical protein
MSDADAKRKAMQMTKPSTVKFGNVMDTIFPSGFLVIQLIEKIEIKL